MKNGYSSGYALLSFLIPLISFPIFYFYGFDESAQFFTPCTNMAVLMVGLVLGIQGIKSGELKTLAIIAVILNIIMLVLYLLQFAFWATFQ